MTPATRIVRVTQPINPCVVAMPDGRIGVLTARLGMHGIVQFRKQKLSETVDLGVLVFYLAPSENARDGRYLHRYSV